MFSGYALHLLPGRDMSKLRRGVLQGIITSNGGKVCEGLTDATQLVGKDFVENSCADITDCQIYTYIHNISI